MRTNITQVFPQTADVVDKDSYTAGGDVTKTPRRWESPLPRGFSLIEVMVGMAIVAIGGLAAGTLMRNAMVAQRDLDRQGQLEILRRIVRTQFDCRKSLGIDPTLPLPQTTACPAGAQTLEIIASDGIELFSMHTSGQFYRVSDWHIRARCVNEQVLFEGRLNSRNRSTSTADNLFGVWQDVFSGTSRFCSEYLSSALNSCNSAPYTELMGFDKQGAVCCRIEHATGPGHAVAQCAPFEVMARGGGMCASGPTDGTLAGEGRTRRVVKTRLQGPGLGTTKPTRTTVAPPLVPHFMFPSADIVADILGPWQNATVRRGGFLVKSVPAAGNAGTLDRWEAACRADDWLDDFTTSAFAVCCPKRW